SIVPVQRPTGQQFCGSLSRLHSPGADMAYDLVMLPTPIDDLDRRLIHAMADAPRTGMLELARRLRVARGTAQARLDKLLARGVVNRMLEVQGIDRTSTVIALSAQVPYRVLPLVAP